MNGFVIAWMESMGSKARRIFLILKAQKQAAEANKLAAMNERPKYDLTEEFKKLKP
jgi:hypothetical protein